MILFLKIYEVYRNPGYLLRGEPQRNLVIEVIEPCKRAHTSMSNIQGV
jgi:hypothetical protein